MRVLRLHGAGDLRLHDEADPVPAPGEELVRITGVGLCGSDLHWYEDGGIGDARVTTPLVLGHEMGGTIATGPRAGTRVALDPAVPCERCDRCVAGHGNLCRALSFSGHGRTDGALRELMAWPARLLVEVPDHIPDEQVPLLESLGVALHATDLGHLEPGMRAGVYGVGPIGLLLVGALRAMGLREIVVSDPLPHRRAAALAMGATAAYEVDADGMSPGAVAHPVDVAFETAGEDGAVNTACAALEPGGKVVVVGIPPTDRTTIVAGTARRKGLSLIMSRRMKAFHLPRALALAESGLVPLAPLVTARYPLSEGPAAFQALVRRDGLKIVIDPGA
jgi:L-iditol 2-dehydrogenase